jgi:O-antigen ligase
MKESNRFTLLRFSEFILGSVIALFYLSGNFDLSRLGLGDVELRYLLLPLVLHVLLLCRLVSGLQYSVPGPDKIILTSVFLILVLIFTAFWSEAPEHAVNTVVDLQIMMISLALTSIGAFHHPRLIHGLLLTLFVFGLLYAIVAIQNAFQSGGRGSIFLGGPNVATRVMFIGFLAAISLYSLRKSLTFLLLTPVLLLGILAIGSRGGIVGALLVMAVGVILLMVNRKVFLAHFGRKPLYIVFFCSVALMVMLFPLVQSAFESRVVSLLINRIHFAGRDELYVNAVELIFESPVMGYGLSGYYRYGFNLYPHNMFLEFSLDGGLLLFALGLILLTLILFRLRTSNALQAIFALGMVYMFIVQQFSGGYYDFRYFFMFAAISLARIGSNPKSLVFNSRCKVVNVV